jgi:UDP-N-acetylglucosamine--N-acetylmuramyl-(pentapeptide) pyrophosphoryl-undecaprenol N-acetylglucosamine transferase
LKARNLLHEIDPLAVIGFGGYPTLPPIMAARSASRRPFTSRTP